jgi:hypothetical protein
MGKRRVVASASETSESEAESEAAPSPPRKRAPAPAAEPAACPWCRERGLPGGRVPLDDLKAAREVEVYVADGRLHTHARDAWLGVRCVAGHLVNVRVARAAACCKGRPGAPVPLSAAVSKGDYEHQYDDPRLRWEGGAWAAPKE